ncbi:DNA topoisomerase IV [Patiriisocius sp. Uisw_017]|uniref:DNA topoisomerase IV n=1 Tax=Patiriisocius sp. Uisw_017 TaxID=3230968 RepID=UPI0039EB96BA
MRILLLFLCTLLFVGCYNVERNCGDFRTGNFVFKQMVGTDLVESKIVRNEKIAIETFKGVTDTFSVRWINDCEYIMRKLNPKDNYDKQAIHFKILTTTNNSYDFEYKMVVKKQNAPQTALKGTLQKVAD